MEQAKPKIIKYAPLLKAIYACNKPIVVCQGGGDAGKTVSILQNIAVKLTQRKKLVATVTGVDLPNLKGGALRSFERYVLPDIEPWILRYNKSEHIFYYKNGSILEFKSFDNEQDARGSERDYLFMNEANSQTYQMFWQLQRKTRVQTFLDYNPTSVFWVHDKLIGGYGTGIREMQYYGKVQFYRTWHEHNPFLSKEEHEMYESISDPDLYQVYSRGKTGKIKGLIFGHFKEVPKFPTEDIVRIIWGLDLGYTTDPSALMKVAVQGPKKRTGHECCYQPGISAEDMRGLLYYNGYDPNTQDLYCESDPNFINQLRVIGVPAIPAIKGPGSLPAGIAKVREHECFYTASSVNFKKEIETYKFISAQDLITGKEVLTNQPMDAWNHACDAFRYADYTDSFKRTGV